ncbi:thiamine-phosphate kinase [Effusibacillus dendaii]|uniref:Thiamine-monophosphate kinase n=1 Tax=Effusibacillus dendaii TaxID=2743772 RepID=A0A7I8DAH9_9BACL|nr:thiamine-phosphate kinase [Effusibacillus dendaii]BCJ87193.1 thiamine-monophosphate kinase [Effusibacillus dendaii]
MKLQDVGEFGLIELLRAKLQPVDQSVVVGIGDDAAVLSYDAAMNVLLTTDMLVEGIHFREDTIDFQSLGWKSMAASISDIAAMGGIPKHAVISLAIPPSYEILKLEQLYEGIAEIGRLHHTCIIGGDITKTNGPLVISVTLTGQTEQGQALLRSGAQVGDLVFVTNCIGGSAAGLACLQSDRRTLLTPDQQIKLLHFHQRPQPQVQAGRILAGSGFCSSCNDISDGLASELHEIASASGVSIRIEESRLPIDSSVRNFARIDGSDPVNWALYGGEDYQLTGTINPLGYASVLTEFQLHGLEMSIVGRVVQGTGVLLERLSGETIPLAASGYNHFTT